MNPQHVSVALFLLGQVATAGGTYAAIRADLREAIVTAKHAETQAATAHQRIDQIFNRGK